MIHKLLAVLIGMTMVAPVWSNSETATRQVCVDVKDKEGRPVKLKDGSTKQQCREVKLHQKLDNAKAVNPK